MTDLSVPAFIASWGSGAAPADTRRVVVLLHGYGSNEADLASLAPALPRDLAWVSLRAPLALAPGSYSWFPITVPGSPDVEPVLEATSGVTVWIDATVPASASVVALGFSQGGLMASQLLRAVPRRVDAAIILGGFVLAGEQPGDEALAAETPPVFSGRGAADTVIAPDAVARTSAWLPGHSTLTELVYPGLGHGIDARELGDVVAFLEALPKR